MVILGLTGSIGMGKTTAAAMLRRMGVPVYGSDEVVHGLLARGGAAAPAVAAAFPEAVRGGEVDRIALRARVFDDAAALRRLEAIVHPLVRKAQAGFLRRQAARRARVVALDVPLLFEVGLYRACDVVLVVTAPAFLQRARVLARPGMTDEALARILAQQTGDSWKRRRADFVVSSGLGRAPVLRSLRAVARLAADRRGRHWPPRSYMAKPGPYARNRPRHRNDRPRSRLR